MSGKRDDATGGSDRPEGGVAIAPGVRVAEGLLRWSFARSSGPGGQNVNKVSTKAELRVGVDDLPLNGRVRARLRRVAQERGVMLVGGERVIETREDSSGKVHTLERDVGGELVITSQSERSQSGNKNECLAKLRELVVLAQHEPKVRRKTKPSRGSVERRLEAKKRRGEKKRERGRGE